VAELVREDLLEVAFRDVVLVDAQVHVAREVEPAPAVRAIEPEAGAGEATFLAGEQQVCRLTERRRVLGRTCGQAKRPRSPIEQERFPRKAGSERSLDAAQQ
jgi:hypothetical protein